MENRLVYRNSDGVRRTMVTTGDSSLLGVETEFDADKLVDENRELAELHPTRSTNKLLARVPMTVYERSIHEGWDEDDWKKFLNDPDNKHFRVWPGRV